MACRRNFKKAFGGFEFVMFGQDDRWCGFYGLIMQSRLVGWLVD